MTAAFESLPPVFLLLALGLLPRWREIVPDIQTLPIAGITFLACVVCAGVPTAMSAYVLARLMGGDAALVATTVTLQTALSFITILLLIWLSQSFT